MSLMLDPYVKITYSNQEDQCTDLELCTPNTTCVNVKLPIQIQLFRKAILVPKVSSKDVGFDLITSRLSIQQLICKAMLICGSQENL